MKRLALGCGVAVLGFAAFFKAMGDSIDAVIGCGFTCWPF